MKDDKDMADFWQILYDEYLLSKEYVIAISDSKILMEKESVSRESVKIRENIVLPFCHPANSRSSAMSKDSEV